MDNHVDSPQSAEAVANKQGTINYEVLCNLSRRLPEYIIMIIMKRLLTNC